MTQLSTLPSMDHHASRIGIEFISALGMPPPAFVALAADLGCRHIGMALEPIVRLRKFSGWSLRDDAALRRDMIAAMQDRGVSISLGEGFVARPGIDLRDAGGDLDLLCELGVRRVGMISADSDHARALDQCAAFAELADARGLDSLLEFMPGLPIGNVQSAAAAIRHVGKPTFRVLIDTMHFFRSGSTLQQLAALAPEQIGYVQLCDVPRVSRHESYANEARFDRLAPGAGELPLLDFLAAVPGDVIVGLEVPMLDRAEAGMALQELLSGAVESTYELLRKAAGDPGTTCDSRRA